MPDAGTPASVIIQRRVEWPDTDAAGIYHYSTVFRLAEAAEAVLHDRLGMRHDTFGRTPRVRVSAEFHTALRFYDLVDVHFVVKSIRRSSVTYGFELRRDGEVTVAGEIVTVLLAHPEGRSTVWPQRHRELLLTGGPQLPELLGSPDARQA